MNSGVEAPALPAPVSVLQQQVQPRHGHGGMDGTAGSVCWTGSLAGSRGPKSPIAKTAGKPAARTSAMLNGSLEAGRLTGEVRPNGAKPPTKSRLKRNGSTNCELKPKNMFALPRIRSFCYYGIEIGVICGMSVQAFRPHGNTAAAVRHRLAALLVAFLLVPFAALAMETTQPIPPTPVPVGPQVQERDVQSLSEDKPVKEWKPGDPVRVMPDLREDENAESATGEDKGQSQTSSKPIVHEAVAPKVMKGSLQGLTKVKPYKKGDRVRVVPDLRESEPKE